MFLLGGRACLHTHIPIFTHSALLLAILFAQEEFFHANAFSGCQHDEPVAMETGRVGVHIPASQATNLERTIAALSSLISSPYLP
jgi:hypothetical protein